jgi:putative transposase
MKRKKRSPDFKRKVAIEALKERETINEIASRHGLHPVQVSQWKRELEQGAPSMFTTDVTERREAKALREEKESLQQLIGKQAIELEWLKKKLDL